MNAMFKLHIASVSFLATIALAQQAITFPKGGEIFTVGQSITVTWVPQSSVLPLVTLVLWDANPDGIYYAQKGYENFTNTGQVQWIVPNHVGDRRLGLGVGDPGALKNTSSSFIFTIKEAQTSITQTSTSSSIPGSTAASIASETSTTSASATATPGTAMSSTGISPGTVGGIVGGIVAFFLVIGALAAWWFGKRWRRVNVAFFDRKGEQDTEGRINEYPLQYTDESLPGGRVHELPESK